MTRAPHDAPRDDHPAGMAPDRWRVVKALVQAALDEPHGRRHAMVAEACGGDVDLRAEVELLLHAADRRATAHLLAAPAALAAAVGDSAGGAADARDRARAEVMTRLGVALAGRYALEGELGHGGMATVYAAREVQLDRTVAIKVLNADVAMAVGSVRFAREIRLAARLQHPHVVPVLAAGEAAGLPYYVMPLVRGASLRERLRREQCLTLAAAAAIVLEVGGALAYAHRCGIVHRDVKPENILLDEQGHALVADFGIARALGAAAADEGVGALTATGLALGTPAYMSPEQGAADRNVDARSDVYSLACVLYEMLAGEPPYTAPTPLAVIAKHHTAPLPSVRLARADVPLAVDLALQRALAKDPAARWPTMDDFVGACAPLVGDAPMGASQAGPPSVAVLDFANATGDAALDWVGAGLGDAISTALRKRSWVRALARERVGRAVGRRSGPIIADADAIAVARVAGAAWVAWGSVDHVAGRLRLTPRFGRADGLALDALDPVEGGSDDLLQMHEHVVRRFDQALVRELDPTKPHDADAASATLGPPATDHVSAYEAFARGRQLFRRFGPASFADARVEFERAVAADPDYALAHAGLGSLFAFRYVATGDSSDLDTAVRHLECARTLDPDLGEAYVWLGYAYVRQGRAADAERCLERAIELEPDNPFAHYFRAGVDVILPRPERPWAERVPAAVMRCVGAIELEPSLQPAYMVLAALYAEHGQYDPARRLLDRAVQIEETVKSRETRFVGALVQRASLHLHEGELDPAVTMLARSLDRYPTADHVYAPAFVALAETTLGEIAAQRREPDVAVAHFTAAAERCGAHPRRTGMGLVLARTRAGLAKAFRALGMRRDEQQQLAAVSALLAGGGPFNCEWVWCASPGQVHYDLASCHAASGRDADAVRELDFAIDLGWGDAPWLERDGGFARLRRAGALAPHLARVRARGPLPEPPPAFWSGTADP